MVQLLIDGSWGHFFFEPEVLELASTSIENDAWEEIDIAAGEGAVFFRAVFFQLDVLVKAIQNYIFQRM